jgi:hypothetical protein
MKNKPGLEFNAPTFQWVEYFNEMSKLSSFDYMFEVYESMWLTESVRKRLESEYLVERIKINENMTDSVFCPYLKYSFIRDTQWFPTCNITMRAFRLNLDKEYIYKIQLEVEYEAGLKEVELNATKLTG